MNSIGILIVNINNLELTKSTINDLENQTSKDFDLTMIDNGSSEPGTKEFLDNMESKKIEVIRNQSNISLVKLWNDFYKNHTNKYLCFLNNDVWLTKNFISDTILVLERDNEVGAAVHVTNNKDYKNKMDELNYIKSTRIKQGWDFTIRREAYTLIPEEIKWYFGDDWVFVKMHEKGLKTAMILSSPISHFQGKSCRFINHTLAFQLDKRVYFSLGMPWDLKSENEYSRISYDGILVNK